MLSSVFSVQFVRPPPRSTLFPTRRSSDLAETVVIFGDYDVDGVTSTALLTEVLRGLGWNVHFYLPHRMDEGYGLDRKSTRLNSSHSQISYAVFCLKKKKQPVSVRTRVHRS